MVLRLLFSVFGMVTVNMPSLKDAFALASSTLSGKDSVRWNSPRVISRRKYLPFSSSFFSSLVEVRMVIVWLLIVTSRSSFLIPGSAAWTSTSLPWSIISTFGNPLSSPAGKLKSNRRGHLRERKSSKKLSNSSNENKPPVGTLGITSVLFLYLFLYCS